jgi:hypothetical protein
LGEGETCKVADKIIKKYVNSLQAKCQKLRNNVVFSAAETFSFIKITRAKLHATNLFVFLITFFYRQSKLYDSLIFPAASVVVILRLPFDSIFQPDGNDFRANSITCKSVFSLFHKKITHGKSSAKCQSICNVIECEHQFD